MGYDGSNYGDFTIHFKEKIRAHAINKYYFQRLLIPFIIYHLFSLLHLVLSIPNIIMAYSVSNLIFIYTGVYFFFRISNFIKLSKSIEVIGFATLFFCFPVLKFSLYYPVLMDIPAFAVAIMMAYLFLKGKPYLFFLMILIGSFIYPNFIFLSILYFFKNDHELSAIRPTQPVSFLNKVLYALVCYTLPVFLCYIFVTLFWWNKVILDEFKTNPGFTFFSWLCFLFALIYIIVLNHFSKMNFSWLRVFKAINYPAIIMAVTIVIAVQLLINYYASTEAVPLTYLQYLYFIINQAVKNPMNFLVAHVFYFGLAPILSLFIIKDIKREVINFGFGMILFFNMAIFFSIGSESRQLINYYPFLVLLLLYSLNKYWEVSMKFSFVFAAICIALSHFWYTINTGISPNASTDYNSCLKFPLQRYFMFQGPWVNDTMYKIHLAVFCFLLVLLWFLVKKTGLVKRKLETVTDVPFYRHNEQLKKSRL